MPQKETGGKNLDGLNASPERTSRRQRWEIERTPVSLASAELAERLGDLAQGAPATYNCFRCETTASLGANNMTWDIGPYRFLLGQVPSYKCGPCDELSFPRTVLAAVSEVVDEKFKQLPQPPRFINPNRIKPTDLGNRQSN